MSGRSRYQPATGSALVPFRRRRSYVKRGYSGKRRRYPQMYRSLGKAGFAAKVRKVVAAERKFLFTNDVFEAAGTLPGSLYLTGIAQGVGQSQRVGNWIQPTSSHGSVTVTGQVDAGGDTVWNVRVFILVFNDNSKDITNTSTRWMQDPTRPHGPFNIERKGEFSVLWTRVLTVSNNSDNTTYSQTLTWRLNLAKQKKILFDGPTSSDRTKFQMFFCAVSDSPSPPAGPPTISVDSQFRFTDS